MLSEILDWTPRAIIVVRTDGWVCHANSAARELLAEKTILGLAEGRLVVMRKAGALDAALVAAAHPVKPKATSVLLPGEDHPDYLFSVLPLLVADRRLAVIGREFPLADGNLDLRLQSLFGLSPAEARIAIGIASGNMVRDLATARGVRESTIRVQLKAVARKLGCRRQAEVAAKIRGLLAVRGHDAQSM